MKPSLLLCVCLALASQAGAADLQRREPQPVESLPEPGQPIIPIDEEESALRFHPLLAFGLSFGGDSVGELRYADGTSSEVNAGGFVQLGAGLMVDFTRIPLQLQTTISYHVDDATASNGSIRFDRWPVELLGFFKLGSTLRLGGGLQYAIAPKASVSLGSQDVSARFGDSLGLVAEGGVVSCTSLCWAINLRFAHQTYEMREVTANGRTSRATSDPVNGNQLGANVFISL